MNEKRPYVQVNVAVSADGKLSTRERRQVKISGLVDFLRVDELKAGSDAIMIGIGTVIADDPSLTIKSQARIDARVNEGKSEHPIRIIVDSMARTPVDAKILHKGPGKRIIATSKDAPKERISMLESYADIISVGDDIVDLALLLLDLKNRGIQRLMVEGGGTLIWGLISAGLVDEISMFIGNIIIGGEDAPTLADGQGFIREDEFCRMKLIGAEPVEDGLLVRWKIGDQ